MTFGYFAANSSLTRWTRSGQFFWASSMSQTVTAPVAAFGSAVPPLPSPDVEPDEEQAVRPIASAMIPSVGTS